MSPSSSTSRPSTGDAAHAASAPGSSVSSLLQVRSETLKNSQSMQAQVPTLSQDKVEDRTDEQLPSSNHTTAVSAVITDSTDEEAQPHAQKSRSNTKRKTMPSCSPTSNGSRKCRMPSSALTSSLSLPEPSTSSASPMSGLVPRASSAASSSTKKGISIAPRPLATTDKTTATPIQAAPSSTVSTPSHMCTQTTPIQRPNTILPDHKTAGVDPDTYFVQLVEALWGAKFQIKRAAELNDYFPSVSDAQLQAYNLQVVGLARDNKVAELRAYHKEHGHQALDCYNRFGEGLLNLTCRRGFSDLTRFLLEDAGLSVRVRDDYGRTPLHDACWNATPQLDIARWIMQHDPSLFLAADKRGYTPFQYARKSDWHIWRQFLFDNAQLLQTLVANPEMRDRFAANDEKLTKSED